MGYGTLYITSAIFLLVYTLIAWLVTDRLGLSGMADTLVRALLLAVGFSLYGLLLHWRHRRRQRQAQAQEAARPEIAGVEAEIDYLLRQAEVRLAASRRQRDVKLTSLPVLLLIGESGSAKTSTFLQSGLEPELLAGHLYQENHVCPTRPLNIWLARQAVVVEAGGRLLAEAGGWLHLIRRLQPARLSSLAGRKHAAARGVIVCVDCETFLRPEADELLTAAARNLQARLGEVSQLLGVQLPVYVLFNKLDRIRFFSEFVANLTEEEVHQVMGVTLPMRHDSGGVYAEQETRRLTLAFNELFYALCERRPALLLREADDGRRGAAYEFPREFRKLRRSVVRFLVDLGRPSQLRVNPFLRGFYFSGVRPVVIKEAAPVAKAAEVPVLAGRKGATALFGVDAVPAETPLEGAAVRTRRVPQWLFLGHLFSHVIFQDRPALGLSGLSRQAELWRRALAAGAAAALLLLSAGLTVSYFGNRALQERVRQAALGISRAETGGAAEQLPALAALERLDTLRQSVELLSLYRRQGPPWRLRWGLYTGDSIYPNVRRLYFARFHQLLFGATQASLLEWLRRLPDKPAPNDEYRPTYDTLKAYLITTSHPDKSTREFLSPLLTERWLAGRQIDAERRVLAQKQFDFYSDELRWGNPFSSENDAEAVERARHYLNQFNAAERIYAFMLAEINRQKPAVNFNKQFPGSDAYVRNSRDVAGAFTSEGWGLFQEAVRNVKRFFGGEKWVLGEQATANLDPAKLEPELRQLYRRDFLGNWRAYLASSEVVRYRSVADASQKLQQLSSNQSYLLALFCLASVHTAAASEDAKAPYQPVQYVTPPPCLDRYVQPANAPYVSSLAALQASMERVAKASDPSQSQALAQQTLADAAGAYQATRQIAQNFRIDREGSVDAMVRKLMEDPIRHAEAVLGALGPAQLNAEGRTLCGQFAELARKYPFNTASKVDATLEELDAIFRPTNGKIYSFYETHLRPHLERSGGAWVRKAGSPVRITDNFLRFFNRAMAFSEALYAGESRQARLTYTMAALPAEGLRGITLSLDGQMLQGTGKGGEKRDFTWPGPGEHAARLSGNLGAGDFSFITYEGLWAAFRFFGDADRFQASGAGYMLEWVPRQGQSAQPIRLESGRALTLPFLLDLHGAPPVFQKGYLAGFDCVAEVAR
jgi:type VI secretion system protein ImpL